MSLLIVVGQSLAVYLFLVVVMARTGRSLMGGLTHLQYLIVALLGSAVETALYHGSASLSAGLASAGTLLLADNATSWLLTRCPRLRWLLVGGPVVLVYEGEFLAERLREVGLTEEDVRGAIRKHGHDDLADVRVAVLETSGEIGVVTRQDGTKRAGERVRL